MNDFPVDLVVTYVDNTDNIWRNSISKYSHQSDSVNRYRSYGLLKYWLRGVALNMPFIRTVHLVVSNIEQVPQYVDQNKVHVVLHKDIIPENLLPTFNSTTIEMFLHKIPGLAEHFIYSNDDLYAINSMTADDFFNDGKPIYQLKFYSMHARRKTTYCMNVNSCMLAMKHAAVRDTQYKLCHMSHGMHGMLKSVNEEIS